MKRSHLRTTSLAAVLFATLATTLLSAPDAILVSAGQPVATALGMGWLATISCMGCIGAFVIGSGSTIAGVAVFLAAYPEIGIICVANCAAALK